MKGDQNVDQRTAIIRGSLSGLFSNGEIDISLKQSVLGKPITDASGREVGMMTSIDISGDSFEGVINEKDIGTVVGGGKRLAIFDSSKLEDVAKKFAEIGCTSFRMNRDEIADALEKLNPSD